MSAVEENAPSTQHTNNRYPTPLDALLILSASAVLVLFVLYVATTVMGKSQFRDDLSQILSTVWKKILIGSGGAGVASLALRRYVFKSRPTVNYLLWIPITMAVLFVGLFAAERLVPNPGKAFTHVPIRFGVELPKREAGATDNGLPLIRVAVRSPQTKEVTDALVPVLNGDDDEYPYRSEIEMPTSPDINFLEELNPIVGTHFDSAFTGHMYEICLKANPNKPFPAPDSQEAKAMLIRLTCRASGRCPRATSEASPALACDEKLNQNDGLVRLVGTAYAAASEQQPPPGWVVPSLDSLTKMPELSRVGYTRFDVKFTPEGRALDADRYYYALKVNGQPVYIDGFLPDRTIFPLQSGPNWISFALENLNFTGQDNGYENLQLTVTFLKGGDVVYRQDLQRKYAALLDMPVEEPTPTAVGSFDWTGKYVVPKRENRYEILLASSSSAEAAMRNKTLFDQSGLRIGTQRAVMVVRPPIRKPPNPPFWGLMLGIELPTSQIQFTFSQEETDRYCHWASQQIGNGKGGNLIRSDLKRYEVVHWGYVKYGSCP